MPFKDLDDFEQNLLVLPLHGKEYTIPSVRYDDGIRLSLMFEKQEAGEKFEEIPPDEFNRLMLGTAYDELRADNISWADMRRVVLTVTADFRRGRAVAEVIWETEGDPKAIESWVKANTNRAQRRTAVRTTQRRASGTTPKKTTATN